MAAGIDDYIIEIFKSTSMIIGRSYRKSIVIVLEMKREETA